MTEQEAPQPPPLSPTTPPWAAPAQWKTCLEFALGLVTIVAASWTGVYFWLRWYGPSLTGTTFVLKRELVRTGDLDIKEVLERFLRREVYTFKDLVAEVKSLSTHAANADFEYQKGLVLIFAATFGLLLLSKVIFDWRKERNLKYISASYMGITDSKDVFIPVGTILSPLPRTPLSALQRALYLKSPILSPLAEALVESYLSSPKWPAFPTDTANSAHGKATLLQHVLAVRERALLLTATQALPPLLAELAALGHDLGKRAAYRLEQGQWKRLTNTHDRLSAILIATLPEWATLPVQDQEDLTVAIAFHHKPEQRPSDASPRAIRLLAMLREADGIATEQETSQAQPLPGLASPPLITTTPLVLQATTPIPAILSHSPAATRLQDALSTVVSVLRINTRPFDGRADPERGLLMLLDHGLRDALSVQLNREDQRALDLDRPVETDPGAVVAHPSHIPIAEAFRLLGWLIETWEGQTGVLWDVTIGRRRWRQVWLLRLDRMPPELQTKWGRSSWPIDIIGPSLPTEATPREGPPDVSQVPATVGLPTALRSPSPASSIGSQGGAVTTGGVIFVAAVAFILWFTLQDHEDRLVLACKPVTWLERFMRVDELELDPYSSPMNNFFVSISSRCPDTFGNQASEYASQARSSATKLKNEAGKILNRRVEEVIDGERVVIEGFGESRLIGVRTRRGYEEDAISYLRHAVRKRRFTVDVAVDIDPERLPLITLISQEGDIINADLIQQRLATPWLSRGPWRQW